MAFSPLTINTCQSRVHKCIEDWSVAIASSSLTIPGPYAVLSLSRNSNSAILFCGLVKKPCRLSADAHQLKALTNFQYPIYDRNRNHVNIRILSSVVWTYWLLCALGDIMRGVLFSILNSAFFKFLSHPLNLSSLPPNHFFRILGLGSEMYS